MKQTIGFSYALNHRELRSTQMKAPYYLSALLRMRFSIREEFQGLFHCVFQLARRGVKGAYHDFFAKDSNS